MDLFMYFYIFDPRGEREVKYFERIQGRLLNTLAETHIEGETYRVTAIRPDEFARAYFWDNGGYPGGGKNFGRPIGADA